MSQSFSERPPLDLAQSVFLVLKETCSGKVFFQESANSNEPDTRELLRTLASSQFTLSVLQLHLMIV